MGHYKASCVENSKTEEQEAIAANILPARFKILNLVGRGGMGLVYRAFDQILDRELAVKIMSFDGALDRQLQERFLQEAQTLASLDHINILKCFECGVSPEGYPFHVLEYVDGVSLDAELEKNAFLSPKRFFEVFSQVAAGLAHAHSKQVVHRDLKPGNILLSKEKDGFCVKIIDFGIARVLRPESEEKKNLSSTTQTLTNTGKLLGSPAYMSPEQCKGQQATSLSDIYSLGCIMYECLCGRAPFEVRSAMEIMYKHMQEIPPSLQMKAKSPQAKRLALLIDRCLEKEPASRIQSVEQISHELKEIFASDLELDEFVAVEGREKNHKRRVFIGVGVLTILALLLLGMQIRYQSQADIEVKSFSTLSKEEESELRARENKVEGLFLRLNRKQSILDQKALLETLVENAQELSGLYVRAAERSKAGELLERVLELLERRVNGSNNYALLESRLYFTMALVHDGNEEKSENNFYQALISAQEASNYAASRKQEEIIRKSRIKYRLSRRNWAGAREDFSAIQAIWKEQKLPLKNDLESDHTLVASNGYLQAIAACAVIRDPEEKILALTLAADICEYEISRESSSFPARALSQCLQGMNSVPKTRESKELISRLYGLLARAEDLLSEPELAAQHRQKAAELLK